MVAAQLARFQMHLAPTAALTCAASGAEALAVI
jgi:hypothetical protein